MVYVILDVVSTRLLCYSYGDETLTSSSVWCVVEVCGCFCFGAVNASSLPGAGVVERFASNPLVREGFNGFNGGATFMVKKMA